MIRLVLALSLLASCSDDSAEYAQFLDHKVSCTSLEPRRKAFGDVSICTRGPRYTPSETWLCTSDPRECRVVGSAVKHVLVVDPPAEAPANVNK